MLSSSFPIHSNVAAVLAPAASDPAPANWLLLGSPAAAGFPSPAGDWLEDELDLNTLLVRNRAATFFIRFAGDSLQDLGIHDGDVGGCDRSLRPSFGKVVIASVDGEIVAKVYESLAGRLALTSRNRDVDYPPIYLDQAQEATVWGVVTSVVRRM